MTGGVITAIDMRFQYLRSRQRTSMAHSPFGLPDWRQNFSAPSDEVRQGFRSTVVVRTSLTLSISRIPQALLRRASAQVSVVATGGGLIEA